MKLKIASGQRLTTANSFTNYKLILNISLVIFTFSSLLHENQNGAQALPSLEFEHGQFYKISSAATGKVMSVQGKQFRMEDTDIITSRWTQQDNQVWLALAESTQSNKPVTNPEKFILLPQRQSWGEWKGIVEGGRISANAGTLPEETVVLTLDNNVVNLTQSIFNDSSSQKWITEPAGEDGYILIKNWGNQQCIKNFDFKMLNLLERVRKRIDTFFGITRKTASSPLGTLECNPDDVSETWLLEPVYSLAKSTGRKSRHRKSSQRN